MLLFLFLFNRRCDALNLFTYIIKTEGIFETPEFVVIDIFILLKYENGLERGTRDISFN